MNKVTAIVDNVGEAQQVTERFTKQEVLLRVDPQGPKAKTNYIPIECTGDKVGVFSKSDVGRKVECSFYINGNKGKEGSKYEDRVFVALRYADHNFLDDRDELPMDDDRQF